MLGLHPSLAPIKAGVFPLVKKDGMPEFADKLAKDLRKSFPVFYDESGAIGRRYRRQDEVGTPYCLTVDGQTMQDGTVTLRDRDTLQQERVAADRVGAIIKERHRAVTPRCRSSGCVERGEAFMQEISREYYLAHVRTEAKCRAAADLREARGHPRAATRSS